MSTSSQTLKSSSSIVTTNNHEAYLVNQHKVDLLSALGIIHNVSVHQGHVTLQPGPHSVTPSAFFSETHHSDRESKRHVRYDFKPFTSWTEDLQNVNAQTQTHKDYVQSKIQLNTLIQHLVNDQGYSYPHELAIMASIRQRRSNTGTILSLEINNPDGRKEK